VNFSDLLKSSQVIWNILQNLILKLLFRITSRLSIKIILFQSEIVRLDIESFSQIFCPNNILWDIKKNVSTRITKQNLIEYASSKVEIWYLFTTIRDRFSITEVVSGHISIMIINPDLFDANRLMKRIDHERDRIYPIFSHKSWSV